MLFFEYLHLYIRMLKIYIEIKQITYPYIKLIDYNLKIYIFLKLKDCNGYKKILFISKTDFIVKICFNFFLLLLKLLMYKILKTILCFKLIKLTLSFYIIRYDIPLTTKAIEPSNGFIITRQIFLSHNLFPGVWAHIHCSPAYPTGVI